MSLAGLIDQRPGCLVVRRWFLNAPFGLMRSTAPGKCRQHIGTVGRSKARRAANLHCNLSSPSADHELIGAAGILEPLPSPACDLAVETALLQLREARQCHQGQCGREFATGPPATPAIRLTERAFQRARDDIVEKAHAISSIETSLCLTIRANDNWKMRANVSRENRDRH